MDAVQQALQMIKKTGNNIDQTGSNVYNGIRGATMNFDRFFGFPDNRMSPSTPQNSPVLGAINTVANIPSDIGQGINSLFNKQTMVNPLAQHTAVAASPTPQVLAAAMKANATPTQGISPTQQPSNNNMFSDFTTTSVPPKFSSLIYNSAKQYGIDPNIFASVLFHEHGFSETPGINRNDNGTYDRGIAQLNSATVPDDKIALDPNQAIPKAASILSSYISRSKDLAHGIAAYNVGVGGAQDPETFNGAGKKYLNGVKAGLSPQLIKKLGL